MRSSEFKSVQLSLALPVCVMVVMFGIITSICAGPEKHTIVFVVYCRTEAKECDLQGALRGGVCPYGPYGQRSVWCATQ